MIGRIPKAIKERFMEKFKVVESGCHEWQSTLSKTGYAKIWQNGRQALAHRVSHEIFIGEIPYDKMVLHKCDNRKCVNPDHLYLGTASQNTKDKVLRFKGMWGNMKHYPQSVIDVHRLHQQGLTQTKIGNIVGMHQTHVSRIIRGKARTKLGD